MTESNEFEARTVRGAIRFVLWSLAWTGSMVLVDKAVLYGWYTESFYSVIGIVVNALLGLVVVRTFLRHLGDMDEMQRKIQLDALALSMGVGFVGSFTYSLLTTTGFVTDPEISDIILLMAVTYMASLSFTYLRNR
ncbi:MAG: hypothetical protein HOM68_23025 [Gemmatimonadetes bacterium]|jgi:hypothetical protein|nr:hypothetical protein [Gemmatimonadota bacterium]MBT4610954.1 hypothetical protein [Gemmatimonadota bacterium]MBT5059436.1 hypothetical protein [Gemmatimonadota bacterium]MBT5146524.1 hypothetical protein [Gemmatimonadota bacterium]MBT5591445.1 hypothetical protein [Gemmatimonadota bacterium]